MTRFSKVVMQNTHVFFRTWFLELYFETGTDTVTRFVEVAKK